MKLKTLGCCLSLTLLNACSTLSTTPNNTENVCAIFKQKKGWYEASASTDKKWGVAIPIQMAILHQESHFVADAQPDSHFLLGFIPWFSSSSAYGYSQAQDATWNDYQKKTGNRFATRDNFADSCDFVGWYSQTSYQKLGIDKNDVKNLYLAYHEGLGGFKRQTYNQKPGLLTIADKVAQRAKIFQQQLMHCRLQ